MRHRQAVPTLRAMQHERSRQIVEAARELLPGGVDSPVRAFQALSVKQVSGEAEGHFSSST